MKSANAFSYAISGSFTENQIDRYSDYLNPVSYTHLTLPTSDLV